MAKFDFKNAVKHNKNLKYGGYAMIVTTIVLIVLIVVNVLFDKLGLTIDLTEEEYYSVGDDSMEIINALDQDVDIYAFYASGDEDGNYARMVVNFLEQYVNLSDHLSFSIKDPVGDPAFASQYMKNANETISSGNIVVTSKETGRYKILDLSDMLLITADSSSSNGYKVSAWDAESAITGAVQYVTSDFTPVLYQLSGHGETMLDDKVTDYLNTSNFEVATLSMVAGDEIEPSTYNTILVNNPQNDLTDPEYETLIHYMENGGRLIFLAERGLPVMTNFDKLLARFGLGIDRNGYVIETDTNQFYQYPQLVLPKQQEGDKEAEPGTEGSVNEIIANLEDTEQLMMLAPVNITIADDRNRATDVTQLLFTSDGALIKAEGNDAFAYQEGDEKGPFNLAVLAYEQEQVGNNVKDAKLIVVGSSTFIDYEGASGLTTNGNYKFFLNVCSYLQDAVSSLYIPAKEFTTETLSTTMATALTGGIVYTIVIPLLIVGVGIFIWIRRKNL